MLVGLIVAWLVRLALRLSEDSLTETALTLLAPYAAWLLAERTHTSGVLACVAGGLYLRQGFSAVVAPATRMQATAVWNVLVFVLNGVIFALIGLQLGAIRSGGLAADLGTLVRLGALISLAVIVIRLIWVPPAVVVPRLVSKTLRARDPIPPWSAILLVSWIGMRGIVSLAAALALPATTASGAPFPFRSEIILVTFAVIPFAETHVMEHGLYVLEGKAVYRLNEDWVEVQEGDFMWLRAFCPQACYAGGPGRFRYLLYKDVNRHMKLKRPVGLS